MILSLNMFNILKQLQYCTGSDYGDNLNIIPSRIIPTNLVEDIDEKNIIYYVPPKLGNACVICDRDNKLPSPSAYFQSPNTFLKSFLYLKNVKYYDNVHLPSKANSLLEKYLEKIFRTYSQENTSKKLVQILLNYNSDFDADPGKNPYFSKFLKIILKHEKCNIIVIRANKFGNYYDTVPNKILPNDNPNCPVYVLLQHSNGSFSPYGTLV